MKACFDVVSAEVEKAKNGIARGKKLNEESYSIFKEYCEAIDDIRKEFENCGEATAYIEPESLRAGITIKVFDITVVKKPHMLHELIDRSVRFRAYKVADDVLGIDFTFPKLWQ